MFNMTPVTDEEQKALVAKCRENGWLKEGGYAWQDDPFLEDFPYTFSRANSIEDLREFFEYGNWAIRQGVLFGDLAFINQDDGGDEWWTLKQDADGSWVNFESYTFGNIAKDASKFIRHIAGMQLASIEECEKLEYMPPKSGYEWSGSCFNQNGEGHVRVAGEDFELIVSGSRIGKGLTVVNSALDSSIDYQEEGWSLLQTISEEIKQANVRDTLPAPDITISLSQRADNAAKAVDVLNQNNLANTARNQAR